MSPDMARAAREGAILVLRREEQAFFIHGFAKSARANLRQSELRAVWALANELTRLEEAALGAMLANGTISEVIDDDQTARE